MFCGPYAIIFYAVEIFKDAGVDSNQHMAAIITALVRIGGGILSIFLIKKLPRVKLAMVSMFVMSISMIALGTIIYFKDQYEDNISFQVLPIVLVTIYMFSFGAGKEHSRNLYTTVIIGACILLWHICRSQSPAVCVPGRAAAPRVQCAVRGDHQPGLCHHVHYNQDIPNPAPPYGTSWHLLALCINSNVIKLFLLLPSSRDKRQIFLGDAATFQEKLINSTSMSSVKFWLMWWSK